MKELLLDCCNVESVSRELSAILPGTIGRDEMLRGYARMRGLLGHSDAASRAAASILSDLRR